MSSEFTPAEPEFRQWLRTLLDGRKKMDGLSTSMKDFARFEQARKQALLEAKRKADEMKQLRDFWKRFDER